jgi:hypothetical protein
MQQSVVKFYCFVVQTLLNMFRALLRPSSGARQTAVAASGFRMDVEVDVFSAVVCLLTNRRAPDDGHNNSRNMLSSVFTTNNEILRLIVASSWVFYLSE